MKSLQDPVFIVSTGRCGSTFIARSLNQHPEIIPISELFEPVQEVPFFDTTHEISGEEFYQLLTRQTMQERIEIWRQEKTNELLYLPERDQDVSLLMSYTLPILSNEPWQLLRDIKPRIENFPQDTPANQLIRFFELLKTVFNKQYWVERTGASLPQLPEIIKTWPNARFIHIYRDGRETAASMKKHLIINMFLRKELSTENQQGFYEEPPLEKFGELWNRWILTARDCFQDLKADQVLNISFEEILSDHETSFQKLLTFIKRTSLSENDKQWMSSIGQQIQYPANYWETLSDEEKAKLEDACRDGLQYLGYQLTALKL